MIHLRNDLFVRLVISARALKDSFVERPVVREVEQEPSKLEIIDYPDEDSLKNYVLKPIQTTKPIEEKISAIIDSPELRSLKQELLKLEDLFNSLKEKHGNPEIVNRLASKIEQLKLSIEQKSYF